MIRGSVSMRLRAVAYSGVLIRHPRATFLYDTGLCANIHRYLETQPLFFRWTLARFRLVSTLSDELRRFDLKPRDINFVLLSHLHWDHVSGVPDIPGIKLCVNKVEYEAAVRGRVPTHDGLVWELAGDNPLEVFDIDGPPYAGFRASLDLFGDGSILLLPLPGHTPGNTGMLINRSNGQRLFLIGDSAYLGENYLKPTPAHPVFWSMATCDDKVARDTLRQLNRFNRVHPHVPLIAMHDRDAQQAFIRSEAGKPQLRLP